MLIVFIAVHVVVCCIGLVSNLLLLWLALTKSPRIMRPCSVLLTCKTITNCLVVFFDLMTINTVKVGELEFHGICTYINPHACYISHLFMLILLNQNLIWLIVSYLFRYYIIYIKEPTVNSMLYSSGCLTIITFCQVSFWYLNPDLKNLSTVFILCMMSVTGVLIIITYVWLRHYILKFIKLHEGSLTSEVKCLNKKLVEIIDFQVKMPVVIFTGTLCLALPYYYENLEMLKYGVTLAVSCYTLSSSLCYIYYLPPYKNFLVKKYRDISTVTETQISEIKK